MKFFAAVLLLLLWATSNAESTRPTDAQDKDMACRVKGEIFRGAAEFRDKGLPPESTYEYVTGSWFNAYSPRVPGIETEYIKKAVNLVYFNPAFANAGGTRLASQIAGDCMRDGKPQFQPLK